MTTELDRVNALVAPIEARANKATPGPWNIEREMGIEDDPDDTVYAVESIGPLVHVQFRGDIIGDGEQADADAEFVSEARIDVPALIAELRAMAGKSDRRSDQLRVALEHADHAQNIGEKMIRERDALRERLAKLEAALHVALELNGPPNDECGCGFCNLSRDISGLLNDTKGGG
jgi:hypothetical protein